MVTKCPYSASYRLAVFFIWKPWASTVKNSTFGTQGRSATFSKKLVFPPKSELSTLKIHCGQTVRANRKRFILELPPFNTSRLVSSKPQQTFRKKRYEPAHGRGVVKKWKKSTPAFHSASAVARRAFDPLTFICANNLAF